MIDDFRREYRWLSNFDTTPFELTAKLDFMQLPVNVPFKSVEHAYQAAKAITEEERDAILNQPTCRKAKELGGSISLRPDWEAVKYFVMLRLIFEKFTQNKELEEKLVATKGFTLIEGNTWHDNYWGDCCCNRCTEIEGKNNLGIILETVRNIL